MKRAFNYVPSRPTAIMLACLPFILAVIIYLIGSEMRLAENPKDKLMPSFSSFGEAMNASPSRSGR
ncbi:MAG: hypothetical protein AAFQ73_16730 [Pseudomonadota bacterium]